MDPKGNHVPADAGKSSSRNVNVEEIVEALENGITAMEYVADKEDWADHEDAEKAQRLVEKLVGDERETRSRWSSRFVIADEGFCEAIADDLAISVEEAGEAFLGEPIKRVIKVASWILDTVDREIQEGGGVYGQRGPKCAKALRAWAEQNHTGIYRRRQEERQYVEAE